MTDNSKPILGEIKSHTIKLLRCGASGINHNLIEQYASWKWQRRKKKHAAHASVAAAGLNKRPHLVASTETKRGNRQRASFPKTFPCVWKHSVTCKTYTHLSGILVNECQHSERLCYWPRYLLIFQLDKNSCIKGPFKLNFKGPVCNI